MPSWEDVLGECEAAAEHAEALLNSRAAVDIERFAGLASRDLWSLSLPDLPAELLDRAHAVAERQRRLQVELVAAMTTIRQEIAITSAGAAAAPSARFLDRTA